MNCRSFVTFEVVQNECAKFAIMKRTLPVSINCGLNCHDLNSLVCYCSNKVLRESFNFTLRRINFADDFIFGGVTNQSDPIPLTDNFKIAINEISTRIGQKLQSSARIFPKSSNWPYPSLTLCSV